MPIHLLGGTAIDIDAPDLYTPPSNASTMECLRWMSRHVGVKASKKLYFLKHHT